MGYTFGQLKAECRKRLWPAGEQDRLHESHEKDFIDAVVNLQRSVPCLRIDHTDIRPHCSTFYKCGLTVTDAPQGIILGVSVVDKPSQSFPGFTATKVGNMVVASGAVFTADMVGSVIKFQDGSSFQILEFIDPSHVWVLDPALVTQAPDATTSPQYFYLTSHVRFNRQTGFEEKLDDDDGKWHAVEVIGPPGGVQIGPDQTGTP